jgi:hypothetical protein
MFERRHQPLQPLHQFAIRMGKSVAIAVGIDVIALLVGSVGFRRFEGLEWPAALLNAGLVATGNGPITRMQTAAGQIFLLLYAILGVIVFAAVVSVVVAPVLHRTLHAFHVDMPPIEERRP